MFTSLPLGLVTKGTLQMWLYVIRCNITFNHFYFNTISNFHKHQKNSVRSTCSLYPDSPIVNIFLHCFVIYSCTLYFFTYLDVPWRYYDLLSINSLVFSYQCTVNPRDVRKGAGRFLTCFPKEEQCGYARVLGTRQTLVWVEVYLMILFMEGLPRIHLLNPSDYVT